MQSKIEYLVISINMPLSRPFISAVPPRASRLAKEKTKGSSINIAAIKYCCPHRIPVISVKVRDTLMVLAGSPAHLSTFRKAEKIHKDFFE